MELPYVLGTGTGPFIPGIPPPHAWWPLIEASFFCFGTHATLKKQNIVFNKE